MTQSDLRPWSIRRRLTKRILALVILAWFATIGLALIFLNYEINEMLDEELQTLAESTVLSLDASQGTVIPRSIGIDPGNGERILRILPQGQVMTDSVPWPALHQDGFHQVAGWRVLRVTAENAVIELAHNIAWRREELWEAASAFLILILPLAGGLIWALRLLLRQGFAPIERLSQAIAARAPTDLSPVAETGLPTELHPLVADMNGYLSRIEALRRSEREFVANASHELRTPLAAIRAGLDLSADPEARASIPRLDALAHRIEKLLQLARSEAGIGLGTGPCDLLQLLDLICRDLSHPARAQLRLDDGDHEDFKLALDPDALAIVLRNLLENAQLHGSGTVKIRLSEDRLVIRNPVAAAQLDERAFAKGPRSSGMGLGLSIARQLCDAMQLDLTLAQSPGQIEVALDFRKVKL